MKQFVRKVKDNVLLYDDAERLVRDATSNEPWGASGTLMHQIADLTAQRENYGPAMTMIWKRLTDVTYPRHVLKACLLVEFLLRNGSDRFVHDMKQRRRRFEALSKFSDYPNNPELGANVRAKALQLIALLDDDVKRNEQRSTAARTKGKITAVSNMGSPTAAGVDDNHQRSASINNGPTFDEFSKEFPDNNELPAASPSSSKSPEPIAPLGIVSQRSNPIESGAPKRPKEKKEKKKKKEKKRSPDSNEVDGGSDEMIGDFMAAPSNPQANPMFSTRGNASAPSSSKPPADATFEFFSQMSLSPAGSPSNSATFDAFGSAPQSQRQPSSPLDDIFSQQATPQPNDIFGSVSSNQFGQPSGFPVSNGAASPFGRQDDLFGGSSNPSPTSNGLMMPMGSTPMASMQFGGPISAKASPVVSPLPSAKPKPTADIWSDLTNIDSLVAPKKDATRATPAPLLEQKTYQQSPQQGQFQQQFSPQQGAFNAFSGQQQQGFPQQGFNPYQQQQPQQQQQQPFQQQQQPYQQPQQPFQQQQQPFQQQFQQGFPAQMMSNNPYGQQQQGMMMAQQTQQKRM